MKNTKRDSKGRFVAGNTEGQQFRNSGGMAAEMQERSVNSRKQNKTLREAMREALMEDGGGGMTKLEVLVRKAMNNHREGKLTFKDLRNLAIVLGETQLTLTLDQDPNTRPEINIE
jgi:hypothetical protein